MTSPDNSDETPRDLPDGQASQDTAQTAGDDTDVDTSPLPPPPTPTTRRAPSRQTSKAGDAGKTKKGADGGAPGASPGKGKGPDYTGNDHENFAACGMIPSQSSSETFAAFRSRAASNEARLAAQLAAVQATISRLENRANRQHTELANRSDRLHAMLGDHASSVNMSLHHVEDAIAATTSLTTRVEAVEDNLSTISGGLTRVDELLDETRDRQTSLGHLVDRLRDAADAHVPRASAPVGPPAVAPSRQPPPGIFVDDDPMAGAADAAFGRQGTVQRTTDLMPGRAGTGNFQGGANGGGTYRTPATPREGLVGGPNRSSLDLPDDERNSIIPAKRQRVTQGSNVGGGSSSSAGPSMPRTGRNANQRGQQGVRRPGPISPNDVWLRFPRAIADPARAAGYALTYAGMQVSSMTSARRLGDDPRVVSVRFRTHSAATAFINALAAASLAPGLEDLEAGWVDPNSSDLVSAILREGDTAEGS